MIPADLKAKLHADPRMSRCVVEDDECSGRLEWHHAVIFAGRQLNVWWAIHAVCQHHHAIADRKDIRARIVKVIHTLGGEEVRQYEKIRRI
jgi:hypothetical protein